MCVCMLLSAVGMLVSCKKDEVEEVFKPVHGEISTSETTASIDLANYVMSYDKNMSATARKEAASLVSDLRSLSSVSIAIREDMEKNTVTNQNFEILVGQTKRTETEKALSQVKNHGWAIRVFDYKIVVAGTTPIMTRLAVRYFVENFITDEHFTGSVLTIPKAVVYSDMETTTLFEDENNRYTIIYDDQYDDIDENAAIQEENPGKKYDYAGIADPTGGGDTDFVYDFSVGFKTSFSGITGVGLDMLSLDTDDKTPVTCEVLVGNMDRGDVKAQLANIEGDEYGVSFDGRKIYLLAWNAVTLKFTTSALEEVLSDCVFTDKDGNKTYVVPKTFCYKTTMAKSTWNCDFPKPEGANIVLDGTQDVADDCLEYIYSGSGVNVDAYNAYCEKLVSAGYSLLPGSANQIGNDLFRTYVKESDKTSLYVYLSNYSYADEYEITDVLPSIRIIASPTDGILDLPSAEMLNPTDYNNGTYPKTNGFTSTITQMDMDYTVSNNFGNSYFYTLADGSFVVYDGGAGQTTEEDTLWNALEIMYKKSHGGQEPSADDPIHIRAWWLSHEHMDHYRMFKKFLEKYGKNDSLRFDALLFNATSDSEQVNSNNPDKTIRTNIAKLKACVNGGFDFIKMHTGQVFYFVNLKFEVLHTHEDTYPKGLEYFNNSSTVIRGTLKTTGGESDCIWLGDLERIGGRRLCAAYGPTLDADMVQVAHHGYNGVSLLVYELIKPQVVWWPTNNNAFFNQAFKTNSTWHRKVDYALANNISSVELILCADIYNITMAVTGTDEDYTLNHVYDLMGTTISNTNVWTGTSKPTSNKFVIVDKR